jgi:hypothetical protein
VAIICKSSTQIIFLIPLHHNNGRILNDVIIQLKYTIEGVSKIPEAKPREIDLVEGEQNLANSLNGILTGASYPFGSQSHIIYCLQIVCYFRFFPCYIMYIYIRLRTELIRVWWLICASYNLSSFRFVEAKRRRNDKTTKRKVDKIRAKRRQTQPAN